MRILMLLLFCVVRLWDRKLWLLVCSVDALNWTNWFRFNLLCSALVLVSGVSVCLLIGNFHHNLPLFNWKVENFLFLKVTGKFCAATLPLYWILNFFVTLADSFKTVRGRPWMAVNSFACKLSARNQKKANQSQALPEEAAAEHSRFCQGPRVSGNIFC